MRVLALYDIHGNIDALEAILRDAPTPDVVLVGGDAVPGPFVVETLDRLSGATWIRGNGERETATRSNEWGVLSADALGSRAAALGELPLTVVVDGVLYCHATPRSDEEMLTRLSPASAYADALAGVRESVVVAGHTHQQHDLMVDGIRFVNAGSVGMPYEGDGAARWAWVEDGVVTLRSTPYDSVAAGRRMLESWPDERSLNASLIAPVPALEVTEFFEGLRGA